MTDISFIPSDNLYKFLTFCGLAIMMISIYALIKTFQNAHEESIKRTEEMIEDDRAYNKLESIEQKQEFNDHLKFKLSIRKIDREFDQKQRRRDSNTLLLVFVIGIAAAVSGFNLWYYRLQQFEDIRIKIESEKLIHESTVAPKPE